METVCKLEDKYSNLFAGNIILNKKKNWNDVIELSQNQHMWLKSKIKNEIFYISDTMKSFGSPVLNLETLHVRD